MDAHPHFKYADMREEKFEFKKHHKIKEDVPIDEVNCGEGYWHFFHVKKTPTV